MLYPDADAVYERNYVNDAAALVPQVACPHHVDNVHPVTEVEGTKLTQVYIGSCTGGRISDLRTAKGAQGQESGSRNTLPRLPGLQRGLQDGA